MNATSVTPSPLESRRFGLAFGRVEISGDIDPDQLARACQDSDVVVVRCPAEQVGAAAQLARMPGFTSLCADHLCYWERSTTAPVELVLPEHWRIDGSTDPDEVDALIRDSFAGYNNHYSANPLLDPADILDGYCEWARELATTHDAATVLRDRTDHPVGLALVDWSADLPDIRLAGMRSSMQNRGLYQLVIGAVTQRASARGCERLQISTQSHNVNAMRAWARMEFLPVRTIATYHLIRQGLLA